MAKERFEKKGRKKEYKTDTIMKRAVLVYLPSEEMKEKWQKLADKSGLSISRFVIEHVENSLSQENEDTSYGTRADLIKRIKELEEEMREIEKKYEILSKAYERLEEENKRYRTMPFLEEMEGFRKYERKIIEAFKERGKIEKGELFDIIGINPMKQADVAKGINRQLENLERYGLIEDKGRWWVWKY
ncbi:MAG: hypothetical protein H5T45_06475 [Thermoplasmatales archaeon]|nr:hypothetical protein [Thermoplasmatales archaeon]